MKRSSIALLVLLTAGCAFMAGQKLTDQKFVKMVAQGNLTEMNKGAVGLAKAQSEDVKAFATRIAEEHGNIYERLQNVAQENNLEIPKKMDQEHQKKIKDLRGIPADQFDRQYLQIMVEDHAKGVQRFEQSIGKIENPQLTRWAEQTLSILREHLAQAQDLARQRGVDVNKYAEKGRQEAKKGK